MDSTWTPLSLGGVCGVHLESMGQGKVHLIPSTEVGYTFQFIRHQFHVQLGFAMTINKSQGQSVDHIGLDLRTDVFTHGQLYVALSRCTSGRRVKALFKNDAKRATKNIVYPEVLLDYSCLHN